MGPAFLSLSNSGGGKDRNCKGVKDLRDDSQDLLETERVPTEILNVADSKRPAQDSIPVKYEGHRNGRANKAKERRECCKREAHNGGKHGPETGKIDQWRKAPRWYGVNQGDTEPESSSCASGEAVNSSGAMPLQHFSKLQFHCKFNNLLFHTSVLLRS